jgi:hypothetical protein
MNPPTPPAPSPPPLEGTLRVRYIECENLVVRFPGSDFNVQIVGAGDMAGIWVNGGADPIPFAALVASRSQPVALEIWAKGRKLPIALTADGILQVPCTRETGIHAKTDVHTVDLEDVVEAAVAARTVIGQAPEPA